MENRTTATGDGGPDVDPLDGTSPAPQVDPLDEAPPTTPRGSLVLTIVAVVLGAAALLPTGLSFVLGPIGMGCGLVANLKGRRAGFAAAVFAGIATVVGLSLGMLFDLY